MESHFLAYLYRLRYIKRWSLMRNVLHENVAEHSYHVVLLTHVLCSIAKQIYGRSIDTGRALELALFHDATEVFTGDIPTPVKHHNKDILNNFREIESLAASKLTAMVPDALRDTYEPLLTGKQQRDELGQLVKAADLLDAYIKCIMELSAGNREFAVAKKQIEASIASLQLQEVSYFLEHLMPSLEKTVDELTDQ